MIAGLGLLVGIIVGLMLQPEVPLWLEPYLPIAVVAALDAVFGALRAFLDGIFDDKVFVVSFVSNVLIYQKQSFIIGRDYKTLVKLPKTVDTRSGNCVALDRLCELGGRIHRRKLRGDLRGRIGTFRYGRCGFEEVRIGNVKIVLKPDLVLHRFGLYRLWRGHGPVHRFWRIFARFAFCVTGRGCLCRRCLFRGGPGALRRGELSTEEYQHRLRVLEERSP